MLNVTALAWNPFITKMQLKPGKKMEYEFEGWFKDILTELQVHKQAFCISGRTIKIVLSVNQLINRLSAD